MWLTGQHDVAFGTAVSGRPAELAGADTMVGLLINTVPVRANITAATTTAELLEQLHRAYNDTLEHQHLALQRDPPRHRPRPAVRHPVRLRELPDRHRRAVGRHELAITDVTAREYNHYPLTLQGHAGRTNWGCASNTTPTCSTRPASRR